MKRVFTAYLGAASLQVVGAADSQIAQAFQAQEDIVVIGCEITAELVMTDVAGITHGTVELTQAATQTKDGNIARCRVGGYKSGGGDLHLNENVVVMFPKDHGVPVKEDGVLNVAIQIESTATASIHPWVTLYYVKGKASNN